MPPTSATTEAGVGSGLAAGIVAEYTHTQTQRPIAKLSLLFAPGDRPSAATVRDVIDAPSDEIGHETGGARVSFCPEADEGWVELLASGLTFDLSGLAPASPERVAHSAHRFGLAADLDETGLDAVLLLPGQHVAGAGSMIPVIRIMAGLATRLVRALPVSGVCWHPAGSCMEPAYFIRIIDAWLAGGAFPALGMTALVPSADGIVRSAGLDFFIGQELELAARSSEQRADTVKLAMRLADMLVASGRIDRAEALKGPDGESLWAEPSEDRRVVRVRRSES